MTLHPVVRLPAWAALVVVLQVLVALPLYAAVVALLLTAVVWSRERARRLLWRARFLLVAIALVFAWVTPGRLLWAAADWLSPTAEGIMLAAEHVARLIALLMLVALLLEHTSREQLVAGLYALLWPASAIGLDRGRAAIRLGLVLRYVERELPVRRWREWMHVSASLADDAPVRISSMPLGRLDQFLLFVTCAVCGWVLWIA